MINIKLKKLYLHWLSKNQIEYTKNIICSGGNSHMNNTLVK